MKLQKTLSLILVLALVLSMVSLPVAAAQTGNAQTGAALEEAAQTETAWDEMELTGAALDGAAQTGETLDRTALTGEALDGTMLTGAALDGSTSGGMDRDEMGVTEEDLAGTILAGEAASYAVGGLGSYYAEDGTTLLGTVTPYLTAASAKESEEFKFYAVPEQGCELTALSAATADGETADQYIERFADEIGKNYDVRVVTSDNLIRLSALRSGVLRTGSKEFSGEVEWVLGQIDEVLKKSNQGAHRTKLTDGRL